MAPGLSDMAGIYRITNVVVIGLTLSIFLLAFFIGVRSHFRLPVFERYLTSCRSLTAACIGSAFRNVRRTWVRAPLRLFQQSPRVVCFGSHSY